MSRVLVTGAAGFAGGHLLDLLAGSGDEMFAWRRPSASARTGGRHQAVRWDEIELLDAAAVARALERTRPDIVYHLAGAAHVAASWGGAVSTYAVNVLGTHHLLAGLRAARLSARVLVPGSAYVYRPSDRPFEEDDPVEPASPYALSKLAQEVLARRAIEEDGQQVFLTRSFNHTGPRQEPVYAAPAFARQIALIEAGRLAPVIEVGNLQAARDITDVRDTVRAYAAIVARGRAGVVYNVCSGKAWTMREILERLMSMARVPVSVRVDPSRYRPNDAPRLVGSPARLEHETGWVPLHTIGETLSDLLDYWRKELQ